MMLTSVKEFYKKLSKDFSGCNFPGLEIKLLLSLSVKRKPDLHTPSKQKNVSASTTSADLPSSSNSSLDVLKHMIHEVEHEMEEYERWTGREVKGLQSGQGLTGFTLSLVSSLCRLVRYLKEVRAGGYEHFHLGKNVS